MTSNMEEVKIIVGTITATLSLAGSSLLIFTILRSEKKLSAPYRRILFGTSVSDSFQSFGFAASILMSPKGVTPFAIGNMASCSVQGFFFTVGAMAATFYLQSLCIYYFCIIRLNMRSHVFVKKLEPGLHLMPILYSLAVGIYALSQNYYNYNGTVCLTTAIPVNCESEPDVECERGEGALKWTAVFLAFPSMLAFLTICIVMTIIVCSAKKLEQRNKRYLQRFSTPEEDPSSASNSRWHPTIHFSIRRFTPSNFNGESSLIDSSSKRISTMIFGDSKTDGDSRIDGSSKRFSSRIFDSRTDSDKNHSHKLPAEGVETSDDEMIKAPPESPARTSDLSLGDEESNETTIEEEKDDESNDTINKATNETTDEEEGDEIAHAARDPVSLSNPPQAVEDQIDTIEPTKRCTSGKRVSRWNSTSEWLKNVIPQRNNEDEENDEALNDEEIGNKRASTKRVSSTINHRQRRRMEQQTSRTQEVQKQALLYTGSYLLTYGFPWTETIYVNATGKEAPLLLGILIAIFFPLQGFINIFIYCRPHIVSLRKRYPGKYTWLQAFIVVMKSGGG